MLITLVTLTATESARFLFALVTYPILLRAAQRAAFLRSYLKRKTKKAAFVVSDEDFTAGISGFGPANIVESFDSRDLFEF